MPTVSTAVVGCALLIELTLTELDRLGWLCFWRMWFGYIDRYLLDI